VRQITLGLRRKCRRTLQLASAHEPSEQRPERAEVAREQPHRLGVHRKDVGVAASLRLYARERLGGDVPPAKLQRDELLNELQQLRLGAGCVERRDRAPCLYLGPACATPAADARR
jgi:hypothetical protein